MQKLITLFVLLTFSITTNAQLGGVLRKAKNRLVDRVVERTVEKTVDKAAEGISEKLSDKIIGSFGGLFNSDGSMKVDADGNPVLSGNLPFLQGPPAVVEPNEYTISFTTKVTTPDETMEMDYAFDTWKTGIIIRMDDKKDELSNVRMFHDLKEKTTTLATNEGGAWKAYKMWMMDMSAAVAQATENEAAKVSVEATGRTKVVEGYTCEEYIIEHEEGTSTAWITKDIDVNMGSLFTMAGGFGQHNKHSSVDNSGFAPGVGFCLEGTMKDKKGKTSTYTVRNIRRDAAINQAPFDFSGIPVEYDLTKGIPTDMD